MVDALPQISLDTLIGVAPMLGYPLEDRCRIRDAQDVRLLETLQAETSADLRDGSQRDLFCIAPFDVLPIEAGGRKQFHVLEINGAGIGGLSNMTTPAVNAVLNDLCQMAEQLAAPGAMVLVACSGKEDERTPRPNRLVHEKVLYADALRRGFERRGRTARVITLAESATEVRTLPAEQPVVVLGYMKDFQKHVRVDGSGRLFLHERRVHAAVNDRFCLNLVHRFKSQLDLNELQTMNRCFHAGGDKGITYTLLNNFLQAYPYPSIPPVRSERVADRAALIESVTSSLRRGRKTVVKPQGTGHGDGIVFFLAPDEDEVSIARRIDGSIATTADLYGLEGGAFPYTICEFIDSLTIQREHPLRGHRYELRIVVYRDGMKLKAFPSIIKIASEKYDASAPSHLSLINNITASAHAKSKSGTDFMLPLTNRATWDLIGVNREDVGSLCSGLTGFTRFLLDHVQDRPDVFGLPAPRQKQC